MLAAHGGIVFQLQRGQISITQDLLPLLAFATSRELHIIPILYLILYLFKGKVFKLFF